MTLMASLDPATVQNGYALAGVVIGALTFAVGFLFRYITVLWGKISDLQDARLKDSVDARNQYDAVMKGFSQTTELLYNKLRQP